MSNASAKADDTRLIEWRESRAKIAEAERQERLRKRDEARSKIEAERKRFQRETARALLPQEDALVTVDKQLRRQRIKRLAGFWCQFCVLVAAPVIAAAWYLTFVATPLFEARTVIAITKPENVAGANEVGILGRLGRSDDVQDVFMAHEYVQSQAMMDQLEETLSLETRFSSDLIDPLHRLRTFSGIPYTKHDQFGRFVDSSVNVQTGLLTIYVRDAQRDRAEATAQAIIAFTAAQINKLNDSILDQRVSTSREAVDVAQSELQDARRDFVLLQIRNGEVDPQRRIASIYDSINAMEAEVMSLNSEISRARFAGAGEGQKALQAIALKDHLEREIALQRAALVTPSANDAPSLNATLMEFELARLRVDLAQQAYSAALASQADAKEAGVLQRSVFQVVVPPRTSEQATFPKTPTQVALVAIVALAFFAFIRLLGAGGRRFA